MAFMGILLVTFPILVVMSGVILAIIYFFSICLLLMGITGIIMNSLQKRLPESKMDLTKKWHSVSTIIIAVVIALLPIASVVYGIVSTIFS